MIHVPVLTHEVIKYLDPKPNEKFIDCTIDGGGHTKTLLKKTAPKGKILGIDIDKKILQNLILQIQRLGIADRLILINDNFKNLKSIVDNNPTFGDKSKGYYSVSGVLLDLGLSLWHLEKSQRGFSFQKDENLDMRYSECGDLNAQDIINTWPEKKIEQIIREYGEERYSRRIAREVIRQRKKKRIITTFDLVNVIKRAILRNYERNRKRKIHFATRTFQALRIVVNRELHNLEEVLPQAIEILKCGGRIVIISFNSLEDRIVKNFLKGAAKDNRIKILTKKPIIPTREEIGINPKARSAKLRSGEKICQNHYL